MNTDLGLAATAVGQSLMTVFMGSGFASTTRLGMTPQKLAL
jgi:hypothetical protein